MIVRSRRSFLTPPHIKSSPFSTVKFNLRMVWLTVVRTKFSLPVIRPAHHIRSGAVHHKAAGTRDLVEYGGQSPLAPRYPLPTSHHHAGLLSNSLYSAADESVAAVANANSVAASRQSEVSTPRQSVKPLY